MMSRLSTILAGARAESAAVYVWGADYTVCADAVERMGLPLLRVESGGFAAEWTEPLRELLQAGRYRVAYEVLPWQVVEWRELGRSLFKDTVVDQVESQHADDPRWGTDAFAADYAEGLRAIAAATVARLVIARLDDVLTMCTWRVFDRERGLLTARLGLGSTESSSEVLGVLDQLGAEGEDRARLYQLWIASQGWW